jgi:ankyrin repeat protein
MSSIQYTFDQLRDAAKSGHLSIVERLLQDEKVDPSADNNDAITWASVLGHLAVVERLLQDPRVDPSAQNNGAIQLASINGHLAVVNLLLEDPRVDPSAKNNCAIRYAANSSHLAVVERLLQDPRVDPNVFHEEHIWNTMFTDYFSEKSLMVLTAKLAKDFPADSKIIHWKHYIDNYREELFAIAHDLTVVLDVVLDNNGLQRNIWEIIYAYLEHKLPEH